MTVSTAVRAALVAAAKTAAQDPLRAEAAALTADETDQACVRGLSPALAPRSTGFMSRRGARYAVVVQSDLLPLPTWQAAPTSTSARAVTFRPEVVIEGEPEPGAG